MLKTIFMDARLPSHGKGIAPPPHPFGARWAGWLQEYVLPAGLLVLLTGMLWAAERPEYHTLFYSLVAFPAFLLLFHQRDALTALLRSPIFLGFLAFSAYVMLSIAWSDTDKSVGSMLKRPLYIALLFLATTQLALSNPLRLSNVVRLATAVASIGGLLSLFLFVDSNDSRLEGYRALSNPILTAHVYGFFLAITISTLVVDGMWKRPWRILALLAFIAAILATGSRGGLAAGAAAVVTASVLWPNRRGAIACAILAAGALLVVVAVPEVVTQRGLSLRPQIWEQTLMEIRQRPWLGYGYDAYIMLEVPGITEKFPNPHNMLLAVLRQEGIVGLALWLGMHFAAASSAWRYRRHPAVVVCAVALAAGFTASLTEGISYLSRPKEHWFLIWIPLSLLAAACIEARRNEQAEGAGPVRQG